MNIMPETPDVPSDTVRERLDEWLDAQDVDRVSALKSSKERYLYLGPLIALVDGLLWLLGDVTTNFLQPFIVLNVIALAGLHMYAQRPIKDFKSRIKNRVLNVLSERHGLSYSPQLFGRGHEDAFALLGLVPSGTDRASYEDEFKGTVQGVPLRLFECHLEEKRRSGKRTRWETVFRGLMVEIEFNVKDFHRRTLILPRQGLMGWLGTKRHGLERVKLEDPVFEKVFDVYANDQVEARYILTPTFMDRMRLLRRLFKDKPLCAAFDKGSLFMAVDVREPLFEIGDISEPLSTNQTVAKMEEELEIFEEIIRRLNLTTTTKI